MSAIYGQWDASDLLCARSQEWLAYTMRAAFEDRRHGRNGDVNICHPPSMAGRMIHCLSNIYEHDDPGFPAHSLLWVLRDGQASVTCRGLRTGIQPTGTLIAFNCHMKHALRYPKGSYSRLWAAWNMDRDAPWTETDARQAVISALN